MDLELLKKGLDFSKKRKKWVLLAAALGASGYGAYRVYNLPSVVKKRQRFLKLVDALVSIAEVMADSAEAVGVISKNLKEFVLSDCDQIPNSLRQVSKITKSEEFSESLVGFTRALTIGIMRGYRFESRNGYDSVSGSSSFSDRALDKLFSSAGSGFASAVVGSLAKNVVTAFVSDGGSNRSSSVSDESSVMRWVDVISEHKCRELIGDCIQSVVSTAVAVYLDKTMDINPYEEILSGLTNPKHEEKLRDMLALVCNGAIETLVKTSHQVLTSSNSNSDSSYLPKNLRKSPSNISKVFGGQDSVLNGLRARKSFDRNRANGWANKISSTLAVPSNRRFVLDVTGRVTFETMRSFLEFLVDQLSEGLKKSINVVQEEVVDKGLEVYRYATRKSSTVVAICLSLCLHILSGPWILVPQ